MWLPDEPLEAGCVVAARDKFDAWYKAKIIKASEYKVQVHFLGWSEKFDEWMDRHSQRIRRMPLLPGEDPNGRIKTAKQLYSFEDVCRAHSGCQLNTAVAVATPADAAAAIVQEEGVVSVRAVGTISCTAFSKGSAKSGGTGSLLDSVLDIALQKTPSVRTPAAVPAATTARKKAAPTSKAIANLQARKGRKRYGMKKPKHKVSCGFCGQQGDGKFGQGDIIGPFQVTPRSKIFFVHETCAIFAPMVFEDGSVEDGTARLENVAQEIVAHAKNKCTHCGKGGATITCSWGTFTGQSEPVCSKIYHYACILECAGVPDPAVRNCLCPEHVPRMAQSRVKATLKTRSALKCVDCGSSNETAPMLYCTLCGGRYHTTCLKDFCCDVSGKLRKGWQCPVCVRCQKCHRADDEENMIMCEECDKAYHLYCAKPQISEIPQGVWKCEACCMCSDCGATSSAQWFKDCTLCIECNALHEKGDTCPVCDVAYAENREQDLDMINCDTCTKWVHSKCTGITEEVYRYMTTDDRLYECPPCKAKRKTDEENYQKQLIEQVIKAPAVVDEEENAKNAGEHARKSKRKAKTSKQPADAGARRKDADNALAVPMHATVEKWTPEMDALPGHITTLSTDPFTLQQDVCKDCGSLGKGDEGFLLFCLQCGEGFHHYCIGQDFVITKRLLKQGWRCVECMACETCEKSTQEDHLLVCDDCHRSYHTFCCDPPLKEVPQGGWKCGQCRLCTYCGTASSPNGWERDFTVCRPCHRLHQKGNFCLLCHGLYKDKAEPDNQPMIACDYCGEWVHRLCDNLNDDEWRLLQDDDEDNKRITYACKICREFDDSLARLAGPDVPDTPAIAESSRFTVGAEQCASATLEICVDTAALDVDAMQTEKNSMAASDNSGVRKAPDETKMADAKEPSMNTGATVAVTSTDAAPVADVVPARLAASLDVAVLCPETNDVSRARPVSATVTPCVTQASGTASASPATTTSLTRSSTDLALKAVPSPAALGRENGGAAEKSLALLHAAGESAPDADEHGVLHRGALATATESGDAAKIVPQSVSHPISSHSWSAGMINVPGTANEEAQDRQDIFVVKLMPKATLPEVAAMVPAEDAVVKVEMSSRANTGPSFVSEATIHPLRERNASTVVPLVHQLVPTKYTAIDQSATSSICPPASLKSEPWKVGGVLQQPLGCVYCERVFECAWTAVHHASTHHKNTLKAMNARGAGQGVTQEHRNVENLLSASDSVSYRAIWPYAATSPNELHVKIGDEVWATQEPLMNGWVYAIHKRDYTTGYVPFRCLAQGPKPRKPKKPKKPEVLSAAKILESTPHAHTHTHTLARAHASTAAAALPSPNRARVLCCGPMVVYESATHFLRMLACSLHRALSLSCR